MYVNAAAMVALIDAIEAEYPSLIAGVREGEG
jgi:hypothetical protein